MKKSKSFIFPIVFLLIFAVLCTISVVLFINAQPEDGDVLELDGSLYKLAYPLREEQLLMAAERFNDIIENQAEIGAVYYSIIPDKNYFLTDTNLPTMDYDKLQKTMHENMQSAQYIDIFELLTAEDYYRTDMHWRQENIVPVAAKLCESMGAPPPKISDYKIQTVGEFSGLWAEATDRSVESDELVYLESTATKNAIVNSSESGEIAVYTQVDLDAYAYDFFLGGPQALMTIENPDAKSEKELIIFRDSFGSSIAPLFFDSYKKLTLVDLRYMSSTLLSERVDFENADVLFMCSTLIYNSGGMLK